MTRWFAGVLLLVAGSAAANTNFWFLRPGHPDFGPPNTSPTAFGATVEYRVAPHVRNIADTRVNANISIYVPGLGDVPIRRVNFLPQEGFIIGNSDTYPDPNLPESALSYSWYGVGAGAELSFTVYRGVMTARFAQGSQTWVVGTESGGPVFRKMDLSVFPRDYEELEDRADGHAAASTPLALAAPDQSRATDPVSVLVSTRQPLSPPRAVRVPWTRSSQRPLQT